MVLFKPISKVYTNLMILEDIKDHLRIAEEDQSENDMITGYFYAAVDTAEFMTERVLALTVFRTRIEAKDMIVQLPYCEFKRVTKVTAYPSNNVLFNVVGPVGTLSDYIKVDEWTEPASLEILTSNLPAETSHVILEMEFGGAEFLTESIKQGIKMLSYHFYQNPNAVEVGRIATEVPIGVKSLLHLNRFQRF